MMLITAIVEPSRVQALAKTLRLFDVHGMTRCHVTMPARSQRVEIYRGQQWGSTMAARVRLDILTSNADMPDLIRVIASAVQTTEATIWAVRVDQLTRIRTGETGLDAL